MSFFGVSLNYTIGEIKKSLESFIGMVTRGDLTTPQRSMSPRTFRNKLKNFKELEMHPITIPVRWKHVPDVLPNPLGTLDSEVSNYLNKEECEKEIEKRIA
ncbi:hypothetical protein [Sporosarcina limicola]|uniref:Uncharacterized protein n=1 Tax=Sporosarcina limicola TaxID=34101 RepID=A0A927R5G3_9BACL|nr:hypothetical protein [Sporosarcina limicola]MBE1556008.1 hypothetical protein [Sporosarcina limicola]